MNVQQFYGQVAPAMGVAVLIVFVAILAWAYWPKHKERFERDAEIPFRGDDF